MIGAFQVGPFQLNYQQGAAAAPVVAKGGAGGLITFLAWHPGKVASEKIKLELELKQKKKRLKTIDRKIKIAEAKLEPTQTREPPQGILANLHLLKEKRAELRERIEITAVNLQAAREFLGELKFPDDDEDDLIAILYDS
jgi:hypothetical protein